MVIFHCYVSSPEGMYLFIVVAIADRRRLHLLWGDAGDAVWDMLSHPALELLFRNPIPQDFGSTSAICWIQNEYPLVNVNRKLWKIYPFLMGKLTINGHIQ